MADTGNKSKPSPLSGTPLVLLTLAVSCAVFMEVLDITIVNVSVPTISGELAVSPDQGTWAISSYSLTSAIMQPLTGWIARRFGEVRVFCISIALFVLFSTLCGVATSMPMLIAFRLMQGLVSGPMVPLSQTLLLNNYPSSRKGIALALWAMTILVAPIFGPILGGWLTDNYSWRWIFFINIPVGIVAVGISWTLLRSRESKTEKKRIDSVGLGLLIIGVGALQYMLDNGQDKDWFASTQILVMGLIAAVALTFLVAWELTDRDPVVDLTLFRKRNFTIGTIALSLGFFAFFGINVVYPLWLQTTMGYTAYLAGLAIAPSGILAIILSPLIGANIARLNLRIVTSFGFLVFALSSFWFSTFSTDSSFTQLLWPRLVLGIALANFFVPVQQILLSGLKPAEIASAAGLSNFFRVIAGSISTAVTTSLWARRGEYHHAVLAQSVAPGRSGVADYRDTLQQLGAPPMQSLAAINQAVNRQADTLALNDVFLLFGVMFLLIIGVIWLSRPPFGNADAEGAGG